MNSHRNLAAEPNGTYNVLGGSFINFVPAFTEKERIASYFSVVPLNPEILLTCNEKKTMQFKNLSLNVWEVYLHSHLYDLA